MVGPITLSRLFLAGASEGGDYTVGWISEA
jgi:hypothetical protein